MTTLGVLVITLATKWGTSVSAQKMRLKRAELENRYSKLRTDYNQLFETRKSAEEQAKNLEAEVVELNQTLEEAKIDRNEELGG
jgi:uncharacterized coiled-coil DUF342 family protein